MLRTIVATLMAGLAIALVAGCGDDDDGDRSTTTAATTAAAPAPTPLVITDTALTAPATLAGGVVAMTFRNEGTTLHEFAIGRAEEGRTPEEILAAVPAAADGEGPAWLTDIAGPGGLTPGAELTITRTLEPGLYVVFDAVPDAQGRRGFERGLAAVISVEGDSGGAAPTADAVIAATDAGFDIPPIAGGERTIELRNDAAEGREFRLGTLNPGATGEDVGRWAGEFDATGRHPAGPIPVTFLGAVQTLRPGASVLVTLTLEAGRGYLLSDDNTGAQAELIPG